MTNVNQAMACGGSCGAATVTIAVSLTGGGNGTMNWNRVVPGTPCPLAGASGFPALGSNSATKTCYIPGVSAFQQVLTWNSSNFLAGSSPAILWCTTGSAQTLTVTE